MKKILTVLLSIAMIFCLVGCSSSTTETETNGGDEATTTEGEVAVFWYTLADDYISSVKTALNAELDAAGIKYTDYDANGQQADQTNQITTALAAGVKVLLVNQVTSNSIDTAKSILEAAEAAGAKVVFFNRSVGSDEEAEALLNQYGSVFVGTDYTQAGHLEGQMIGEYLVANYDDVDLNGDGTISYAMFKGDEANEEAIARTQYAVEDANAALEAAGKPVLKYFDESATTLYQVDQNGQWSAAAATDYMQTNLSLYSEAEGNMIELVIANNDSMALGAIEALKNAGYNVAGGVTIPVFGVDATDAAKAAISAGEMVGSVKQDAEGMAKVAALCAQNLLVDAAATDGVPSDYDVVGTWRVNIPYSAYTAE